MSEPQPERQWQFEAIGTSWWLGIYEIISDMQWSDLQSAISMRIAEFDAAYSRFRSDSLVINMAERAGDYEMPQDFAVLWQWHRQLYDATGGRVTPLIGQTLSDAGYDATYSFVEKPLVTPPAWDDVLAFDGSTLTVTQPALLDVGATGKGYLVDIISDTLRAASLQKFCVDASGDMYMQGVKLRIGLEHPAVNDTVIGVASVSNISLCGSAGNRRAWGKYHHVIDPQSLESPRHIAAVWVMSSQAMHADGLTTALYFVEPTKLQTVVDFEYLILYADGMMTRSAGFKADIFGEQS